MPLGRKRRKRIALAAVLLLDSAAGPQPSVYDKGRSQKLEVPAVPELAIAEPANKYESSLIVAPARSMMLRFWSYAETVNWKSDD